MELSPNPTFEELSTTLAIKIQVFIKQNRENLIKIAKKDRSSMPVDNCILAKSSINFPNRQTIVKKQSRLANFLKENIGKYKKKLIQEIRITLYVIKLIFLITTPGFKFYK
jgi:hypothetical protein